MKQLSNGKLLISYGFGLGISATILLLMDLGGTWLNIGLYLLGAMSVIRGCQKYVKGDET